MANNLFTKSPDWTSSSTDPYDEQFGDIVETSTLGNADTYDTILVGEPYDGAVLSNPGARDGPAGLRDVLAGTKSAPLSNDPVCSVGDLGDINIPVRDSVRAVQSWMKEATAQVHELDAFPVFMGGDHSVAYPNVAPLLDRDETIGVVNFDAHADVRKVVDQPYNGTPFRQLFKKGLDAYALIGARDFETSTAYLDYLDERDATVVSAEEVRFDVDGAIKTVLAAMDGADAVYVSCDIDVLDMTMSPGSTAPTPGGLTTRELYRMLRWTASDDRVVGFGLVGCAPMLDEKEKSLKAGSRAIAHFMSGQQ